MATKPSPQDAAGVLITELEPLLPSAVSTLKIYFDNHEATRGERDKAKIALQLVNTAISLQRAMWTQQRHEVSIARTLSDGDLDVFQGYIQSTLPTFPQVRKVPLKQP